VAVIGTFYVFLFNRRSLLAVSAEHGVALHYDSLNGCNEHEARATTAKLASLLKSRTAFISSNRLIIGLAFHTMPSPQQDNSSDCGIYVLLATSVLVERLLAPEESLQKGSNPWSLENISFNANTGRLQIQRMIAEMIDQRGKKIGTKVDIEITPSPNVNPEQVPPARVS
jgi:Ulp1 family protease